MKSQIIWLSIFVLLYWSYCMYWGFRGAMMSKTASDYFIAGRNISIWVFVLAATATSFSGWTFMGHPGLIYRDGFQYAYASFYAITIPFTGVLFLKRQWILGKRYGFVTPGEMFHTYFRSDLMRILTVVVALIFSVPYLGIQLRASGFLFNVLTEGALSVEVGMWMLSIVVLIYVASGGLRAVAYVDTLQAILLAVGIVAIGVIALNYVGGWGQLNEGIAALALADKNLTPDGYSHYVAIPGVIQFVAGLGVENPKGGAWTGVMILTYMFALMGIQSSPAFSMWAFSNKDPRPFAPQQVWASSFGIGLILFFFTASQGLGGHLLGADTAFTAMEPGHVNNVLGSGLGGSDLMQAAGKQGMLVPQLIFLMSDAVPWFVGFLAVCALAAMQSTGAAYMSTFGAMLTRDIIKRFIMPNADHNTQKVIGRTCVAIVVMMALVVATTATDALVLLGGLAVAYGFQMWPALLAICWFPSLTRTGVALGLIVGLIAVTLTENVGVNYVLKPLFDGEAPWGRWPWTMHSAGWGIIFNLAVVLFFARLLPDKDIEHRMQYHNFLAEHAALPEEKRSLIPAAWIITLLWFFFGIGPGAVLGNTIFGSPTDASTWVFGMPSIWAWQVLFWILGVGMMWFLAYKMELSTPVSKEVKPLTDDIGDVVPASKA